MTSHWFLPVATAALLVGCASVAGAELSAERRGAAESFAINNVTTSLYHEFGHLLIDQFDWPVLGREENAADTIMTMLLLDEGAAGVAVATDAVRGYLAASKQYGETLPENHDFYGEHELEVQRGMLMACLLVGADRTTYLALAEEIGMGENRIEGCRDDADLARRSWGKLKQQTGDGAALSVEYDAPGEAYGPIADLMRERRLLETVAERMQARFSLRRDATLKARLCGDDDAYYDGSRNEITLCYEYTQFYYDLIADPVQPDN